MTKVIGIDLGSTNSCVAIMEGKEAKVIENSQRDINIAFMNDITKLFNKLNIDVVNITPKEGLLVLFPSYLHHSVEINQSSDDRIVISFNIDLLN